MATYTVYNINIKNATTYDIHDDYARTLANALNEAVITIKNNISDYRNNYTTEYSSSVIKKAIDNLDERLTAAEELYTTLKNSI